MAGWTRKKREAVETAFYKFLGRCFVNSKDSGRICLGEHLYEGQRRTITEIFDALEEDIHNIFILKARQLGISTLIRALIAFLAGVHDGLKGAIVFDTDNNKQESRAELEVMINDLPGTLKFPGIKSNNRAGLTLDNDSKLLFMSAGVRKSKSSGTLGRSVGLALSHQSECCSYDNEEGLESFEQSLSDVNPDRLYIKESTARGFNKWWSDWVQARKDKGHCRCIFLGWWSKESQSIARSDPDFELYGTTPPSDKEREKIEYVRQHYKHEITPAQLAWIRRKMDPTAVRQGEAEPEFEGSTTRIQEQPWTEEEAFQQTGAVFFAAEKLTELTNKYVSNKYQTYMFHAGVEFVDMRVFKASTGKSVDLKVWEEPDPDGVYCLGIDPAFGENELNDRSSIQVLRCYADGIDQVAEYASPLINTRQLAWVIAAVMGWYGRDNATVRYALELNGPGTAVFGEIKSLRHQIENGYQPREIEEKGLKDIFRNVRTFIWNRPDSMGTGSALHIKTTQQTKILFMERMRDFVSNGMFHIRSLDLIDEMKTIAREGDSIKAPGSMKDDRVLAAAFAVHCWETGPRKQLMTQRRTREAEAARKRLSIVDQASLFQQNMLSSFFDQKRRARIAERQLAMRAAWRSR